ncbi:hypothetical protein [Qipengyuania sp. JC766]|uniref:hypothetical protein n=1 Tax=Qipengyuania sp. JC766 TaxID=3232139 RepID=UPI003457A94A
MRHVLVILAMLFLTQPALAQIAAPPGWTVADDRGTARTFTSPDGEMVTVVENPDDPEVDAEMVAINLLASMRTYGCPSSDGGAADIGDGKAVVVWARDSEIECGVAAGRSGEKFVMVMCVCAPGDDGPRAFDAFTSGYFARELLAASDAQQETTPAAPTRRGGSVTSSGTSGVWVALVHRTVYDPVLTVRMEYGPAYLVLTEGGRFMTEVATGTALDDEGVAAYTAEHPDEGGRFRITGNRLILTYASGETQVAAIGGSGSAREYDIEGDTYQPKMVFPDGTALSGFYGNSSITRVSQSVFVAGESDFVFAPDGRFARGGKVSTTGESFSVLGGRDQRSGRYQVEGSALHLTYDDGEREVLSMWQEEPGGPIWFDGAMYEPEG